MISEAKKAGNKKWRDKNKEKTKEYKKKYYDDNKLKTKYYNISYYLNNKNKRSLYEKKRKELDPLYKLTENIRTAISKSISKKGYTKKSKTHTILGCSFEEFKTYIESKFELWMNWHNYGKYNGELNHGWDIDHIIQLHTAETEEDIIRLNHYTNLQPLCSHVNRNIKR